MSQDKNILLPLKGILVLTMYIHLIVVNIHSKKY